MSRKHLLGIIIVASILAGVLLNSATYAITNGEPDDGRHPYVGLLVFDDAPGHPAWRCTGSLISPWVVLCAGHCTDGAVAGRFWLYEDVTYDHVPFPLYPYGGPGSGAIEGTPYCHPDFCIGCGHGLPGFATHDVGVLILSEPVYLNTAPFYIDRYGELPSEGLVDTLAMKEDLDLVGYGVQTMHRGGGQPYWTGIRWRFYAPAQLIASEHVISDEFIRVTANPAQGKGGTSFGDSGGPVLLAGTDTILAVNSFVASYECAGNTYSCRVDTADVLDWIQEFLD